MFKYRDTSEWEKVLVIQFLSSVFAGFLLTNLNLRLLKLLVVRNCHLHLRDPGIQSEEPSDNPLIVAVLSRTSSHAVVNRGSLRQIIETLVPDHQDDAFIWLPTWLHACRPFLVRVALFDSELKRCLHHFCPFPLLAKHLNAVLLNDDLD